MTALYVPPTEESDHTKQNMSLQLIGGVTSTNVTNIATNTASIATLTGKLGYYYNVRDYGAIGNGVADDTVAIQAAITAAQAVGAIVFFPAGTYKITASLTISARCKIKGEGFQGDSGGGFAGVGVTQSTGFLGSVIVAGTTVSAFVATTNKAVSFEDVQITYPSTPSSGAIAITIQAVAGAGNANTQSFIRNCMITGADQGIVLTNCLDFRIDSNDILYSVTYGIVVNSPNYPSYNQASISNNEIWGAANAGFQAHILLQAGGDMRIVNNKISTGGVNTNGIAIFGASSGSQNMEPLVIANNSIEGPQNCIAFVTANASLSISNIVISGNQLWGGGKAILANTFGTGQWILGVAISGNLLSVNGGVGVTVVQLDNVSGASITGNVLNLSGGGSASAGFVLGSHCLNITSVGNNYVNGISTRVSESGSNYIYDSPLGVSAAATMGASPTTVTARSRPETHHIRQNGTNTASISKNSQVIHLLVNASTYYVVELMPGESYVTTWTTTAPTYTKDVH